MNNDCKRNILTEFLKLYENLPALWNCNDKNYGNEIEKELCYKKLLQIYQQIDANADIIAVKTKIESMTANYRRELDKVTECSFSGQNNPYVPTLWYYERLDGIIGKQELMVGGLQSTGTETLKEPDLEDSFNYEDADMLAAEWATHYKQLCKQQQQYAKATVAAVFALAQQQLLTEQSAIFSDSSACLIDSILENFAMENLQIPHENHEQFSAAANELQLRASKINSDLYCEKCKKSFASRASLRKHTLSHLGIKPYACDICDASFVDPSNLKTHRQRHLGEKPYLCTVCGKTFTTSSELKLHMRSHTKEKPYTCTECTCAYSNASNLKEHMRSHCDAYEFACEICHKRFKKRAALRKHKLIHSHERPFICAACGATFRLRKSLAQHLQLHSGLKPYVCETCQAKFAQRSGLAGHKKRCSLH